MLGKEPAENVRDFYVLMDILRVPVQPTKEDIKKTFMTPVAVKRRPTTSKTSQQDDDGD